MSPLERDLEIELWNELTETQGPVRTGETGSIRPDQGAEYDQHIGHTREREESKSQAARFQRALGVDGEGVTGQRSRSPARDDERF